MSIAPGAGGGAPACFYPAGADRGRRQPPQCRPRRRHPANISDRARYAPAWGALTHECGHAKHTTWEPPRAGPPGVLAAAVLLEEPRMEAAQARRHPDDRHWLRAYARDIVVADLHLFADPATALKMTAPNAAHTAALIFGNRVRPLTLPGKAPAAVTEFHSNDNWEDVPTALDALDGALGLSTPGAARLLVIVSDGRFRDQSRHDGQKRLNRLRATTH